MELQRKFFRMAWSILSVVYMILGLCFPSFYAEICGRGGALNDREPYSYKDY